MKHRKSEHPSLLLIDHQPDINHDLPSPPNLPPLPESDSDEPISPTKRKANGFDEGDNEPSDKIPKPVKRKVNSIDGNDKKRFKFNDSEIVDDSEESSDEPIIPPPKKDDKYKNLYHELEGRLIALQDKKDDLVDQYNECQREVLRLKDEIEDLLKKNRMLSDKVADINSNMISNHAFKCTSIEEFAYLRNLFREAISNRLAFIVSNRESTGIGKPNKNPINNANKRYHLLKLLHSYVGSCSGMIGSWRKAKVSNDIFTFSVMP